MTNPQTKFNGPNPFSGLTVTEKTSSPSISSEPTQVPVKKAKDPVKTAEQLREQFLVQKVNQLTLKSTQKQYTIGLLRDQVRRQQANLDKARTERAELRGALAETQKKFRNDVRKMHSKLLKVAATLPTRSAHVVDAIKAAEDLIEALAKGDYRKGNQDG